MPCFPVSLVNSTLVFSTLISKNTKNSLKPLIPPIYTSKHSEHLTSLTLDTIYNVYRKREKIETIHNCSQLLNKLIPSSQRERIQIKLGNTYLDHILYYNYLGLEISASSIFGLAWNALKQKAFGAF